MTDTMCRCWWCGGPLVRDNDFTSDDVLGDGQDRLVTFLHCSECGARVQYTEPGEGEE